MLRYSLLKRPQAVDVQSVCAGDRLTVLFPLQDLHLHKFFQHCQLMRTTSEGSPAELIKYLKVRVSGSFRSNASVLIPSPTSPCLSSPPAVLACHGDSCDHQLPPNDPDAAVRGAHGSDQRSPRDCRQLSAVSGSLVAAFSCALMIPA